MARHNFIEFESVTLYDSFLDKSLDAHVLTTPVDELTSKLKTFIVSGEEVDFDPLVGTSLVSALRRATLLQQRGTVVDCMTLTMLFCGGVCLDMPRRSHDGDIPVNELEHSVWTSLSDVQAEVLTPMLLGRETPNGKTMPFHSHASILPEKGLWLEKLGVYNVVLSQLDEIAAFYELDRSARAYRVRKTYGDTPVISYSADIPPSEQTFTIRTGTIT